jgi:3-oxoacyl-[acyl-carrier-protein] synthase II
MNKVVVTGMGVVSPVGNTVASFWDAICAGRSGIGPITRFDTTGYASRIAGEADDVMPAGMTAKDLNRQDRFTTLALEAADQAWTQSGLDMSREDPYRCGVYIGSGIGGIETIAHDVVRLHEGGPRRVSPLMIPKGLVNMASGNVAIRLGLCGPNKAIVTACATATHCIGDAAAVIRLGEADVMIAGGSEATVVPFGLAGFSAMKALSTRNDEPERASRPFDLDRDGFVIAEGAGLLVLESEEHARARGAEILGVVAGLGESCDAHHITAPRPDGEPAVAAMRKALAAAQVSADRVDYYNAHGTSTKYNDASEAQALRAVFGERMPPVSSTKSMIGHLLGAAGAVEAIACLLAIRDGVLPPSINYDTPDPECVVNIVANEARPARVAITMSNSLGFGGHNATIVLTRYD